LGEKLICNTIFFVTENERIVEEEMGSTGRWLILKFDLSLSRLLAFSSQKKRRIARARMTIKRVLSLCIQAFATYDKFCKNHFVSLITLLRFFVFV
jgi:hypothetical protein